MTATLKDVMVALEMPTAEFSKEWKRLTEQDKIDLKNWVDAENAQKS
jgi:hypothetical protein